MSFSMGPPRLVDSSVSAAINAVINGAIAWFGFKGSTSVPLSMDSIGSPGITALGNAATLTFALVLILTCITFFVFRASARKSSAAPEALRSMQFMPGGLRIAVANTLLAFGAFVTAAVIWQRVVGTIEVDPVGAALVVALVAALATAFAEWRTKVEMLVLARASR